MDTLIEVLESFGDLKNETIRDNIVKCWSIINNRGYNNICCSISGGSDSDIMLDIVYKCDKDKKVKYVFIDTGLEYQATKDHIKYLEYRYNIKIERERAIKSIPLAVKQNGIPFISKTVSSRLSRLQKYGFEFDDTDDYKYLIKKYCKKLDEPVGKCIELDGEYYTGCISGILWWCNAEYNFKGNKTPLSTRIGYNKYLKEFLIENPPTFKISDSCCYYAKKKTIHDVYNKLNCDLSIIGVRKAEGGQRAISYKSCFSEETSLNMAQYRPLFWYTEDDKRDYEINQNIIHSDCYTKWGFKRTGCCGCPFAGNHLNMEAECTKKYEPKLYRAMRTVFGPAYDLQNRYREFRKKMELKEKGKKRLF